MQVLVSDTSVLIDIERASLTARLFDLPYDFVVPDILYEAELLDWMGPDLIDLGARPRPDTDPSVICADVGRLESIKWAPRYSLHDGLRDCLQRQGFLGGES